MELSRKGREAIKLGPMSLGGDTEEEKDYTDLKINPGD